MTSSTPPAESRDADEAWNTVAKHNGPNTAKVFRAAVEASIAEALAKLSPKPAAPSPCEECGGAKFVCNLPCVKGSQNGRFGCRSEDCEDNRRPCPKCAAPSPKPAAEAKGGYPERLKLLQTHSKWEGVPCIEQRIFDTATEIAGAVVYVRADVAEDGDGSVFAEISQALDQLVGESLPQAAARVMRQLATEKLRADEAERKIRTLSPEIPAGDMPERIAVWRCVATAPAYGWGEGLQPWVEGRTEYVRAEAADNAERRAIYAETELAEMKRKLEETEKALLEREARCEEHGQWQRNAAREAYAERDKVTRENTALRAERIESLATIARLACELTDARGQS